MCGGFGTAWTPLRLRRVVALGAAALLALLLVAPAAGADKRDQPPLPSSLLGITPNTTPTGQDLAKIAETGASTVRYGLPWASMQARKGDPIDWAERDRFMVQASRAGLDVDLVLATTPRWLRSSPSASTWQPPLTSNTAKEAWKGFVRAVAARYGRGGSFWRAHPGLTYRPAVWTIWNEPNLKRFWGGPPGAGAFAELVGLAGGVLHQVDPRGTVVAGGVFCEWNWKDYLRRFYDAADKSSFDAVAFHPYSESPYGSFKLMLEGRAIMDHQGDPNAEYWIDEISWGTDTSQDRFTTTPKLQAERMRILFQILEAQRNRLKLGKVLWYGLRDDPNAHDCLFCATSGLWYVGGLKPKPAWFVFKAFGTVPAGEIRGTVSRESSKPLAGQTVYLDLNGDDWPEVGEPRAKTGDDGTFSFAGLYPTTYALRVMPTSDQVCEQPAGCSRTVEVASGQVAGEQRFQLAHAGVSTKITKAKIKLRRAAFKFRAAGVDPPYEFKCKLDHSPYRKCSSWKTYKHLSRGRHVFKVRAEDAAGRVDRTAAKRKFKIRRH